MALLPQANLGQNEDFAAAERKAKKLGAVQVNELGQLPGLRYNGSNASSPVNYVQFLIGGKLGHVPPDKR